MPPQKNTTAKALWTIVILVIVVVIAYLALHQSSSSAVSVVPPASSTSPTSSTTTPSIDETGWLTSTDATTGLSFSYPAELATAYIHAAAPDYWPPTVTEASGAFSCVPGGSSIMQDGKTAEVSVNGHEYCVNTQGQGTAGSTYNQYAYSFQRGSDVITLTFTLQYPDCGNYGDGPRVTACNTEETSFDVNALADAMAQTLH